jgi:Fe-S-cluster containining protein
MGDPSPLPCVTCHASCCQYRAVVTSLDAVRMQRALGRTITDFTTLIDHDPDGVGFRLRPGGRRFRIALAHRTTLPLRGWCTFFDPDHHPGGCTIYSARPTPCRVYPAAIRFGRIELRMPAACPDGAWTAGSPLWGESWRRTAQRAVTEQMIDHVINVAWNRAIDPLAGTSGGAPPEDRETDAETSAEAPFRRYLQWVVEVCERLDSHTGCLDRAQPLSPAAVTAAKAMLRR